MMSALGPAPERQVINEMRQRLRLERDSQNRQREKDAYNELRTRSSNLRAEFFKAEHNLLGLLDLMHEQKAELEQVTKDLSARHQKLYNAPYTSASDDMSMIEIPVVSRGEQVPVNAPCSCASRGPTGSTGPAPEPRPAPRPVQRPAQGPAPELMQRPALQPETETEEPAHHNPIDLRSVSPAVPSPVHQPEEPEEPKGPEKADPVTLEIKDAPKSFAAHMDQADMLKVLLQWSRSKPFPFDLRQIRQKRDKFVTFGCTATGTCSGATGKPDRCGFELHYGKIGALSGWALMHPHSFFTHIHNKWSTGNGPRHAEMRTREPVSTEPPNAAPPMTCFKRVYPQEIIAEQPPNVDRQGKRSTLGPV